MEENKNLIPEQQELSGQNTEPQTEAAAEVSAETTVEERAETTAEVQTEATAEEQAEPQTEVIAEVQAETTAEVQAETTAEVQPEPQAEVRAFSGSMTPPGVAPQPMRQPDYTPRPMQPPMGGIYTVPVVQQPMMQQPMRPSYCYQNPYQNFGLYTAPAPMYTPMPASAPAPAPAPAPETVGAEDGEGDASAKKKHRYLPLVITSAIAGGIMLICCCIIAFGVMRDMVAGNNGGDMIHDDRPSSNPTEESTGGVERDENAVYNMPDIQTSEKSGKELSLVEINNKVKNSVTGILIGLEGKEEFVFSGSGVIISEDGYILTNNHVIDGAAKLKVVLSDGISEYEAAVVGKDDRSDLAVLKVEANGLMAAELGNSDQLEVGETVVAIGNPYGMELAGTVTNGIVSALNRKIEMNGSFMTLIQTNASINPGNSGGPLVNAYGQVIGITSSKLVATGYEGIGFAIPINHVVEISGELISYGYIKTRAYIGIQGSDLEEGYAEYYGFPQGVYVYYVDPECDAAKKGLKKDDIIIGFAGEEIESMAELNDLKDQYKPGDEVSLSVWRNEKVFDIKITLTETV